jgi:flagellar basal-body rod modification protein FlgD
VSRARDRILEASIDDSLAASLIGRDVRATSDSVRLESGAPAEFFVSIVRPARVTATIATESGQAVRTLDLGALPAGENRIVWDGRGDDAAALAPGRYRIRLEGVDAAGVRVTAKTATTGAVSGLRFFDGRTFLIIDGREVALEDVVEISAGTLNRAL